MITSHFHCESLVVRIQSIMFTDSRTYMVLSEKDLEEVKGQKARQ